MEHDISKNLKSKEHATTFTVGSEIFRNPCKLYLQHQADPSKSFSSHALPPKQFSALYSPMLNQRDQQRETHNLALKSLVQGPEFLLEMSPKTLLLRVGLLEAFLINQQSGNNRNDLIETEKQIKQRGR